MGDNVVMRSSVVEANANRGENRWYWCLFCETGAEEVVCREIHKRFPSATALMVRQVKRQSKQGVTERVLLPIFPGYIFVSSETMLILSRDMHIGKLIRVLEEDDGIQPLSGTNRAFAEWIFSVNGIIGFSKAYRENDRIRIASGPLKAMEGYIIKVDKRNQNALVSINFGSQQFRAWLGFDLVESL